MRSLVPIALLVAATTLLVAGCSKKDAETSGPKGNPQEWSWLAETQPKLMAQRAELRALVASQRAAATDEEKAAIAEQITASEAALTQASEDFTGRLVAYINSLDMLKGEPLQGEQLAAMRMKSAEDMELAREWIEKGGDYIKAIEIYSAQLNNDPDNAELQAALASAEEMRFMQAERFAAVKKGMSRDEVREALGQVLIRNIREDAEKEVITWLYRTEDGGAAGVFFKLDQKKGDYVVYDSKFDYVKAQVTTTGAADPAES